MTECVCCPLCEEGGNHPYLFEYPSCLGGDVGLGLNRCRTCSLRYVSPRLNREGLAHLYNSGYLSNTVSGANTTDSEIPKREYERFFDYVTHYLPNGGRLLDVGCGVGGFMRQFPRVGKFEIEGVEFSEYAAGQAVKAGLRVSNADFLESSYPDAAFECVIMLYVLEHVPRPKAALEKALSILKPGGYLMIAVPNYRHFRLIADNRVIRWLRAHPSPLHSEEHLQNFTPATLQRMVCGRGFRRVRWGLAQPLNVGGPWIVRAKWAAYGLVRVLYALGYHLTGMHLVARKPV